MEHAWFLRERPSTLQMYRLEASLHVSCSNEKLSGSPRSAGMQCMLQPGKDLHVSFSALQLTLQPVSSRIQGLPTAAAAFARSVRKVFANCSTTFAGSPHGCGSAAARNLPILNQT